MHEIIILIVALAILFDISNGWNDSANAIATVVSTRVLSPMKAVLLAAFMNIAGAFVSTGVAKTIGKGIVDPKIIANQPEVIASALIAGFLWNGMMTLFGMPVSASHALIGGLMGGVIAYGGFSILNTAGLMKIFAALLTSPVIGIFFGYFFMKLLIRFFCNISPGTLNKHFGRLQLVSAGFMAFSHGSNDAQKAMGVITLALVSGGYLQTLEVPFWVILSCGLAMGLGTAVGGWRVIKTLGHQMLKLQPVHGFAAETSATAVILGASVLGLPVSTTHVISTSIMGVGATKRLTAVRWGVAGKIVIAWIFTLPMCFAIAWLSYHIIVKILR
ncbi:MAG: inorganic phosphate transporter [Thermodesulfovibrionia bacterium]|nr:inorganic phosphate transporter [Thermodesulfovibrionia bacterium]MCK5426723.1 inorganic phosphate transporter [Thermodesulfovibrionia bacterium]MCK5512229.1 inorganic phosphate transporter [Thermodesulfovibrionia bacterium]